MKYNEDMHICQKKIEDAMNIVKYLIEKINDYKTHNKQMKLFSENELKQILTLIRKIRIIFLFPNGLNYSFPLAIHFNHINNTLLYNSLTNIPKGTININGPNIFATKSNNNNINLFNILPNVTHRYLPYTLYDLRIKNTLNFNNNSLLNTESLFQNHNLQ
jgi:hypothetical protein